MGHRTTVNNKECKIRGIGKVRVQLKDGSSFVLHNVRYIPELKRNLISLGTLEKEGYTVKLQSGKVKVINGSRVILSGIRRDNCVYSLDGHAMAGELNASVEEKDSLAQVWHKRLGHISEAGLQVLEKQGLFGKKSLVDDSYFQFRLIRVRLRWNHWEFKEKKQLKESTGYGIKELRTDNGLEFCNRVRCLIKSSDLPKTFWAKATCTAAYILNRLLNATSGCKLCVRLQDSKFRSSFQDCRLLNVLGFKYL
ncbi:retrovirus-related pol polyprotein from transposon TNT 1-94, partial [Tanacetum coccineum]